MYLCSIDMVPGCLVPRPLMAQADEDFKRQTQRHGMVFPPLPVSLLLLASQDTVDYGTQPVLSVGSSSELLMYKRSICLPFQRLFFLADSSERIFQSGHR